jgi:TonB family protein
MRMICIRLSVVLLLLLFSLGVAQAQQPVGSTGAAETDLPDPNAFRKVDQQPKVLNIDEVKDEIEYPSEAKKKKIEGRVILKVLVDEEGRPIKHVMLKSPHPMLTRAAVEGLYLLRFSPAIKDGEAIKFWVVVPFDFVITKELRHQNKRRRRQEGW